MLSDPSSSGAVVIANVSSTPSDGEVSHCILKKGEHPACSRDSYLRCEEARAPLVAHLEALLKAGKLSLTTGLEAGLVKRCQQRLGSSKLTPREAKAILREQKLIP